MSAFRGCLSIEVNGRTVGTFGIVPLYRGCPLLRGCTCTLSGFHCISFIRPKLSNTQFGFTKGKSCLAQLLTIFSTINQAADSKKSVDVMYLDFKKAFDSVPHEQLLFKLCIIGPLWNWYRCYLTNRLHYVTIDGNQSSTWPVTSGVPQGSILGPLLFLIYINDLPSCINYSHCLLFADDAKIFQMVTSFHDQLLLQIDLHKIEQWCSTWNLQLNPSKCHVLKFMLRSQDLMFLLKCLKDPDDNINIHRYITFTSARTRATTHNQLKLNYNRTSTTQYFYFN